MLLVLNKREGDFVRTNRRIASGFAKERKDESVARVGSRTTAATADLEKVINEKTARATRTIEIIWVTSAILDVVPNSRLRILPLSHDCMGENVRCMK